MDLHAVNVALRGADEADATLRTVPTRSREDSMPKDVVEHRYGRRLRLPRSLKEREAVQGRSTTTP